jgi:hypothetical protein
MHLGAIYHTSPAAAATGGSENERVTPNLMGISHEYREHIDA